SHTSILSLQILSERSAAVAVATPGCLNLESFIYDFYAFLARAALATIDRYLPSSREKRQLERYAALSVSRADLNCCRQEFLTLPRTPLRADNGVTGVEEIVAPAHR